MTYYNYHECDYCKEVIDVGAKYYKVEFIMVDKKNYKRKSLGSKEACGACLRRIKKEFKEGFV